MHFQRRCAAVAALVTPHPIITETNAGQHRAYVLATAQGSRTPSAPTRLRQLPQRHMGDTRR